MTLQKPSDFKEKVIQLLKQLYTELAKCDRLQAIPGSFCECLVKVNKNSAGHIVSKKNTLQTELAY